MTRITIEGGSFGAGEQPECLQCRAPMTLFGRETHPDHGSAYELQSFYCKRCGWLDTRSVDQDGKPFLEH